MIIWFTGPTDAGKTTIMRELAKLLDVCSVYDGVTIPDDAALPILYASVPQLETDREYIKVFVNTPLVICKDRDTKGTYREIKKGRLPPFPEYDHSDADITLCTVCTSPEDNARKVLGYYETRRI